MKRIALEDLAPLPVPAGLWNELGEKGEQGPPGRDSTIPGPRGDDGKPGLGFAMKGNWTARHEYQTNDCVRHASAVWACSSPNKGRSPREGSEFWTVLIKDGRRGERGETGAAGQRGRSVRIEVDGNKAAAFFDSAVVRGNAVYISDDNHVDLAQADSESTAFAVGLAAAARQPGDYGEYVTGGPFRNDAWSWTPGAMVFLSPSVPGGLTQIAAVSAGQLVTYIGRASTPTEIILEIERGILIAQEPEE